MDGRKLLNSQTQYMISRVAAHPKITLVGSFESYRYPMICRIEGAIYMNVDTYAPYINELPPIYSGEIHKKSAQDGLIYVYKSLNSNQKDIVGVLAKVLHKKKIVNVNNMCICFRDLRLKSSLKSV